MIEDWALEGDAINLVARTPRGLVWQVEFSEDLARWTSVGTVRAGATFEGSTARRVGFYRLRLLEASEP